MGTLRLILAIAVVFQHIAGIPFFGGHAVIFFFVISGYLMTLVMHGSYGYTVSGFGRFWLNRVLRLYPSYLVLIAISTVVLLAVPASTLGTFKEELGIPPSPWGWLQNLTMIYWNFTPYGVAPRIAPATWALTTELAFYFLISLGISRNKGFTLMWLAVSLAYAGFALMQPDSYRYVYFAVTAGSLPFCCGALVHHFRDTFRKIVQGREKRVIFGLGATLFCIVVLRILVHVKADLPIVDSLAILATTPIALLIVAAFVISKWAPFPRKWDKRFGDMSYPVYISHWTCGLLVAWAFDVENRIRSVEGILVTLGALAVAFLFSAFVIRFIDPKIESLRSIIRTKEHIRLPREAINPF